MSRKSKTLVAFVIAVLTFSGCTAPTDPFVEVVKTTSVEAGFTDSKVMASGCVGVYLFCPQPMYEPIFYIPAPAGAEAACDALFKVAGNLGVVAYSVVGSSAAKLENSIAEAKAMCKEGLGSPLKNFDGSDLYQGIALYDDGQEDSFGKVYVFNRQNSEFGDVFMLIISFSKDSSRVGPIPFGSQKPKLMSQEELDAGNELNAIAAETMKFANPLLGQDEKLAIQKIEDAGYTWVIVDRDGKEFPTDKMYDPKRIRLTIREGVVYDAIAG